MAAIVVEDGTGLATSNSYVSNTEINAYVADRGFTAVTSPETLAHIAMDWLEQQNFKGDKNTDAQALQWPRANVDIDGYTVLTTTIPQLLKDAQIELVIAISAGTSPLANLERETKIEKVDVIEVEYMTSSRSQTYLQAVEFKLKKLLKHSGQLRSIRV